MRPSLPSTKPRRIPDPQAFAAASQDDTSQGGYKRAPTVTWTHPPADALDRVAIGQHWGIND
ncbi:MAG: hypothetical protein C5B50_19095 [Verrucomicrobia bacterium]|nr:MAG: hypothetical protein C5B50_19095 [Verrucomicrobiota bacterium]